MTSVLSEGPQAGSDDRPVEHPATGLVLAVGSSVDFGLAGPLARGLFDTGWSPGAVVLVRVTIGALAVLPVGLVSLRGRWHVLRANAGLLLLYGALAVAGAQFCYFAAVERMDVAPALLIEFTAPAAVVAWLWLRRGERPGQLAVAGAAVSAVGLALVLDLAGGFHLDGIGVAWSFGAMIGCATYFVVNGHGDTGLPLYALAAGGLVVGAIGLALAGATGLLRITTRTADVTLAGGTTRWWVPLVLLGLVTAAFPYVTGIAAGRRLGSRLASFLALLEVVAGVVFAWLLLDQTPGPLQVAGGVLVVGGVSLVHAGER
jgi:drug/metabolite transporter (DMT)-like permease